MITSVAAIWASVDAFAGNLSVLPGTLGPVTNNGLNYDQGSHRRPRLPQGAGVRPLGPLASRPRAAGDPKATAPALQQTVGLEFRNLEEWLTAE